MHDQAVIIYAKDKGLVPDIRTDSGPLLRALLAACRDRGAIRLVLSPGRYDFYADQCEEHVYALSNTEYANPRRCAIVMRDLEDIHLDLRGVELRFHGRAMPITLDHCRRIVIEGGNIDWDFPLTAQAEVLAASSEMLELHIDAQQHPFFIEDGKIIFAAEGWRAPLRELMEFEPRSGHIPPGSGDRTPGDGWQSYQAIQVDGGRVRMHGRFTHPPQVGNWLVMRHGPRDHAGIFIVESQDVALRSLALHHSSGLGILCQHSENLEFSQVDIVPSSGRYFAGHDDGIHVSNCRGHVQMIGCRFAGLLDDPVNVHGTSVRIVHRLAANRLRCRFMHHESVGMPFARSGDHIAFLDHRTLRSVGVATVCQVDSWDLFTVDITFDRAVPEEITINDALENLTWTPDLTIRDSWFGCSRARGLLVSTPGRVRIEQNCFESSGSAILIAGDANYWYESGAVRDVLIKNNRFTDICNSSDYQFTEGIISIYPTIPHTELRYPYHQHIRIEQNEFTTCEISVLYALSVQGLTFTDNRIVRSHRFLPRADHRHVLSHSHDFGDDRQHLVTLDHCHAIEISGNSCAGDLLNREVALLGTPRAQLTLDANDGFTIYNAHPTHDDVEGH
jgi:hypothetical protein